MSRRRPARRCRAHRHDGQPCAAYAITGGAVCRMHGGGAPQVRSAARRRIEQAQMNAALEAMWNRYVQERQAWQDARVAETAELLGMPAEEVTDVDITWARAVHGRPGGEETAPRLRVDQRYGPHSR